jgi:hypothetical protein
MRWDIWTCRGSWHSASVLLTDRLRANQLSLVAGVDTLHRWLPAAQTERPMQGRNSLARNCPHPGAVIVPG